MSILILSALIGLAANYFNPNGIPLIRTSKEIVWASDSLFYSEEKDPNLNITQNVDRSDSGINKEIQTNNQSEKIEKSNPTEKINTEEGPIIKEVEEKTIKPDVIAFEEPKNITLEQAYSLFKKGVTFIDARDEVEYLAGHITNSINIPYYDYENYKQRMKNLSKDNPLVIYCAGTDCDLSILLANQLSKIDYKEIYIFFGGWLEWQKANYPTEEIPDS